MYSSSAIFFFFNFFLRHCALCFTGYNASTWWSRRHGNHSDTISGFRLWIWINQLTLFFHIIGAYFYFDVSIVVFFLPLNFFFLTTLLLPPWRIHIFFRFSFSKVVAAVLFGNIFVFLIVCLKENWNQIMIIQTNLDFMNECTLALQQQVFSYQIISAGQFSNN